MYASWRRGDETVAALEVLFTDNAVYPDGVSQTAYIILHANIGFLSFSLMFASSNYFLYVITRLLSFFFFFFFSIFPLCVSVYTVNVSLVLYGDGKITNPQTVTSNSFSFPPT